MRRATLASVFFLLLAVPSLRAEEGTEPAPDRLEALQARVAAMRALMESLQERLGDLEKAMDREEQGDAVARRRPKPKPKPEPAEEAEPDDASTEAPAEAEDTEAEPATEEPTEPGIDPLILEVAGRWEIEPDAFFEAMEAMLREQMADQGVPDDFLDTLLDQMRTELGNMSMAFVFETDMTWTATAEVMDEEQTASGTWSREDDEVLLVQTHENDEEMDEPIELRGTLEDGLLRLEPDEDAAAALPFVLVLKKVEAGD